MLNTATVLVLDHCVDDHILLNLRHLSLLEGHCHFKGILLIFLQVGSLYLELVCYRLCLVLHQHDIIDPEGWQDLNQVSLFIPECCRHILHSHLVRPRWVGHCEDNALR